MKPGRGTGWKKLTKAARSDRARKAAINRWANATPEQRKDTGAMLTASRRAPSREGEG